MRDIIKGPGISVELDTREIYPHDPGMGTPVLISLDNGETVTWNCGISEGETVDGTKFNQEELDWLNWVTPQVEQWMKDNGL